MMTKTDAVQFQSIRIISDPRILNLVKVIGSMSGNSKNSLEIILSETGNIFFRGVFDKEEAVRLAETYFEREGYMHSELTKVSPSTSVDITFSKKFEDGVVQFAGLGHEWGSEPGYCWALYGQMNSEKK